MYLRDKEREMKVALRRLCEKNSEPEDRDQELINLRTIVNKLEADGLLILR